MEVPAVLVGQAVAQLLLDSIYFTSVPQPPGRGPVPGLGINYIGPREVLLEFVILVFEAFFMNKYFIVEIF